MKLMQRSLLALLASCAALPLAAQTTILVEIDYMANHQPSQAEIDAVVQMFACQGITLVAFIDELVPTEFVIECDSPGNDLFFTCTGPGTFSWYREEYKDMTPDWHYCLFANRYDDGNGIDSSGLAELPGNDLLVADGVLSGCLDGRPFRRASTFAHELGHNLGLTHASPVSSGGNLGPFAPNFPSVMNYRFQLQGIRSQLQADGLVGNLHLFKELDFSSGRMPILPEAVLNETLGLKIRPVDWDCDGIFEPSVAKNIDVDADWCTGNLDADVLRDHNEWAAIRSQPLPLVTDDSIAVPYVTCAGLSAAGGGGCDAVPTLTNEPCIQGLMVWADPNAGPLFQQGTGANPFVNFDTAVDQSPDGSVLFVQPGNHSFATPGSVLLDRPMLFDGPGSAVLNPN